MDDAAGMLPNAKGTAAVQLPAIWISVAVPTRLFGLLPRFTPVTWGVLVAFVVVHLLGSPASSPQ